MNPLKNASLVIFCLTLSGVASANSDAQLQENSSLKQGEVQAMLAHEIQDNVDYLKSTISFEQPLLVKPTAVLSRSTRLAASNYMPKRVIKATP
ncbi:hypothetical protein [Psychrobium sp. 1_MG-2023]|uniref:hypothetical protein n=1 Tax=Psychrobium sp. 1_MG-2023 TaxID=3062624 RepID=UPI000C34F6FA|nr:hypothetical protein [Psychrobium sp. 1_MG-2023]MDP2560935.1 hypothetical protein [Psychrobium sp. 1_MG-2023]PKF56007.1 hypothetical protein CW748_11350 [Alteromonadales bacterium alter-6D02]